MPCYLDCLFLENEWLYLAEVVTRRLYLSESINEYCTSTLWTNIERFHHHNFTIRKIRKCERVPVLSGSMTMTKTMPMLFVLLLVSMLGTPVYATPTTTANDNKGEEDKKSDEATTATKEPEPKKDEPTVKEPESATTKTPEPEATPSEELKLTELPKCDGSPQDCITPNGDTCLKGQGGHECECAEDMKDCPNHPSVLSSSTKQENNLEAFTSNNDIDPCLLDPSDPICPKPDPDTQDCPEGYAQNEDGNCFPLHPDGCPSGYHGHEDDETGRCIPNSTPCDPGYEFNDDHSNCEKEHFTCDGKPSVVKCEDNNNHDGKDNEKHKHHDRDVIIKHFHDTKIIKKITDSDSNIDVDQTVVAISYDEGKGINCVIEDDNDGQCETFDVTVDKGKEPLLVVIPFDHN
jgi:hypothetical protein